MAISVVLIALAACESPDSRLAMQWSVPFKKLGLVIVDPPQEDIRVGDVFVYPSNPEPRASTADPVSQPLGTVGRWISLGALGDVDNEYRQRPQWPQTPRPSVDDESRFWPEAVSTGDVFEAGAASTRLRQVALSGITASFEGREKASSLVPAEVSNLVAGTGWDDYKGVMVTVSSAEGYALALDTVLFLLLDKSAADGRTQFVLKERYRRFLPLMTGSRSSVVWIRVVSEVIYMRSIDYTIQAVAPPDEVTDVPPPDLTVVKKPQKAPKAIPGGDPVLLPYRRAEEINRLLSASNTDLAPSAVTRILNASTGSVSLRRIWARPLAVAVRGLALEVDTGTGIVRRIGPLGAPLPEGVLRHAPDEPIDESSST